MSCVSRFRPKGVMCALLVLASAACSSNVVMRRPPVLDTGPLGPFQRCPTGETSCQTDDNYDSSRLNASHTRFFQLPSCPYGIHDIAVLDSGSKDAEVLVRCAAPPPVAEPGAGLPVTAASGGTRPSN